MTEPRERVEEPERLWRCDKCGTEYTADVGTCGQLQPPCDGTVHPVPVLDIVVGTMAAQLAEETSLDEATAWNLLYPPNGALGRVLESGLLALAHTEGEQGR